MQFFDIFKKKGWTLQNVIVATVKASWYYRWLGMRRFGLVCTHSAKHNLRLTSFLTRNADNSKRTTEDERTLQQWWPIYQHTLMHQRHSRHQVSVHVFSSLWNATSTKLSTIRVSGDTACCRRYASVWSHKLIRQAMEEAEQIAESVRWWRNGPRLAHTGLCGGVMVTSPIV